MNNVSQQISSMLNNIHWQNLLYLPFQRRLKILFGNSYLNPIMVKMCPVISNEIWNKYIAKMFIMTNKFQGFRSVVQG